MYIYYRIYIYIYIIGSSGSLTPRVGVRLPEDPIR